MDNNLMDNFLTTLHSHSKDIGITKIYSEVLKMNGTKVSSGTFSNKFTPTSKEHKLTLTEFMSVMKVLELDDNGRHVSVFTDMLEVFNLKCDKHYAEPNVSINYKSISNALVGTSKEHGDVSNEIHEALKNNKISPTEIIKIKKEINDEIDALVKLKAILIKASDSNELIK
ncbi:phage regulatory CII family protein [Moritella dasanensis]|jgi:hypothetical protein|uniref:phage regulatory CII family protein n=1 Tax=Moritella dasanensis TaxID=428031 RepID=UPI0002FDBE16|nr:phage regulatory CII family protein [Moritella dasanensis]